MEDQWRISKHDSRWKDLFNEIALKLRHSLGDLAIRIDHVGSTSIVGFVFREENPDKTKRYFRELPGTRRTHIHVRQVGSFSEQVTLLFRDYLREHPQDCLRYAEEKHRLMELFKNVRPKYVEGKGPIVWDIIQKAHNWSQEVGWKPGRSDK